MNSFWVTKNINCKRCMVYKDTFFGRKVKKGWGLLSPLKYVHGTTTYILDKGYVWDGPSYPQFLEFFVGRKNKDALLAASAMHDALTVKIKIKKFGRIHPLYVRRSIRESALIYRHMIRDWPDDDERISKLKKIKQYFGLLVFQPIYSIFTSRKLWKKAENDEG